MEQAEPNQQGQPAFLIRKKRTGANAPGGYAGNNLLASYLHIHFAGNPDAARRFVDFCADGRQAGRASADG